MRANTLSLLRRLALLAGMTASLAAAAATINVVPDGSSGCKLRQAIKAANTNTAVSPCPAGTGTDILVLQQVDNRPYFATGGGAADEDDNLTGDLDVSSAIIIQGANPEQTVIVGPAADRAFDVLPGGSLTLNDLTVVGGSVIGGSDNDGGVVRKTGTGALTINRSVLRSGTAQYGGAVYASGSGVFELDRVAVYGNHAMVGGAIALQQAAGVEAVFENVTISGNNASVMGGGIYASSWFRLRNGTVTRNRAEAGGGGIEFQDPSTTGVNFANSIITGNISAGGHPSDLRCSPEAQLGSRAYTLIGVLDYCSFATYIGIPASTDARLSPLFDSGSGVPTHALLPGSVALGAGNPSTSNQYTRCLTADARGVSRNNPCDLGAYEEKFDAIVNSSSDLPDLNPGDGACQALGNVCTLRAAAMEASASRGRWFVKVPAGTYALNRAFNALDDGDGGDIDVKVLDHDEPLQMTLFGMGDADDVRIGGSGFDRVLEVRGSRVTSPATVNVNYPLAFALLNATVSGGNLNQDPFEEDPNASLEGGGIKVSGGKTLFHNVVVRDNYVESVPATESSVAGGVYVDVGSLDESLARPYRASSRFEGFAIVDNATAETQGGQGKFAGGLYARGPTPYEIGDGIVLVNGTIAGNISANAGGMRAYGAIDASFLSIVGNASGPLNPPGSPQYAGGLTLGGQNNRFRNVLIAGNLAGEVDSDCEVHDTASSLVSLGYNLIGTSSPGCLVSGDTATNLVDVDPQLVALGVAPSGMPYALPAGSSPVLDAIPRNECADGSGLGVLADALGGARPGTNASCSIGALEREPPLFADGFD